MESNSTEFLLDSGTSCIALMLFSEELKTPELRHFYCTLTHTWEDLVSGHGFFMLTKMPHCLLGSILLAQLFFYLAMNSKDIIFVWGCKRPK